MKKVLSNSPRNLSTNLKNNIKKVIQLSKRVMWRWNVVPPPFRIQIDITDKCNFRCPTCSKWKKKNSVDELNTEQWRAIFKKVGRLPILQEVTVCGGEPFMHPGIFEVLKLAKLAKLYVVVISNGWWVDEGTLRRLGEIGVDRLMLSLNSLRESVHDESRGVPGSFRRIMLAVESWRNMPQKTDLCIETVIMESNCGELTDLADFVKRKGLNGIIYQVLGPVEAHYPFSKESCIPGEDTDWFNRNSRWVRSTGLFHSEIRKLLLLQRQGYPVINLASQFRDFQIYYDNPEVVSYIPCLGTLTTMYIDPFGNVRLCYGYPPIGNILSDEPNRLWRNKYAKDIRNKSKKCLRMCRMLNNNL